MIPLGYVVLYLLLTRPKSTYRVILLFFGSFVTPAKAINSMGWLMFLKGDPELQAGRLVVFGALSLTAWIGLLHLVKDKLARIVRYGLLTRQPAGTYRDQEIE